MKLFRNAVAVALVCSLAAVALAAPSREIVVREGTSLGGTEVPKGAYQLTGKENGTPGEVDVMIKKGATILASAKGRIETRDEAAKEDGVAYRSDNGGKQIAEIRTAGKKDVIVISG